MAEPTIPSLNLFVAGRGEAAQHGLHLATEEGGEWKLRQLDTVVQLAALCAHPRLPIIYGLSGMGPGRVHAWDVTDVVRGGEAVPIAHQDSLGDIPCDLAVDPTGRLLIAANYGFEGTGGSLTVWPLDERGRLEGEGLALPLSGSGSDPSRQGVAHPHQVVFHGGVLFVPDLGAESIRRYRIEPELREIESIPTPTGTGPRHMVVLGGGAIVVSGELAGTIAVGRVDTDDPGWRVERGSLLSGPATTRSERNYPGDVKVSRDQGFVYFANRGYDTIATFALDSGGPRLIGEVELDAEWPQHILVRDDHLLVAAWDGSAVMRLPLVGGIPQSPELAFECDGAGWLLEARER
ncbi:MAG: hypothetical protein JWP85_342 [Rhodoglobus sp.]|nr:hypothetical protein [Rhodoglobus sp.]